MDNQVSARPGTCVPAGLLFPLVYILPEFTPPVKQARMAFVGEEFHKPMDGVGEASLLPRVLSSAI